MARAGIALSIRRVSSLPDDQLTTKDSHFIRCLKKTLLMQQKSIIRGRIARALNPALYQDNCRRE